MKLIIIVPTYNEAENIGRLIEQIQKQVSELNHDVHILVVDDTSPDGTAQAVGQIMEHHPNVHLNTGPKKGLGAAYVRGMQYALDVLDADIVMEMDADFSHDPGDIPRLIAVIDEGADFVIGSRYVSGGKIPQDWAALRKFLSRTGNVLARRIACLNSVHDCTAGFRAIRTSLLKDIELSALNTRGYAFQISLLHEATARRAVIKEIPVEFVDRRRGETKLSFADMLEFIFVVFFLRLKCSIVKPSVSG